MVGIYKIVSPSGRVYIGQSVDIERRFFKYKSELCPQQVRLHASFLKHGIESHVFEVLQECAIEYLNNRERYWQDFYNVISKSGLNCRLTKSADLSGKLSEETKIKIGKKSGATRLGMKLSESHKNKIAIAGTGKIRSKESNLKLSASRKGMVFSESHINNLKTSHGKSVIDTATGKIYYSARYAAECLGMNWNTLMARLNGNCKNTTTLKYQ